MLEDDRPYPGDPPEEYKGCSRFDLKPGSPDYYILRDHLIVKDLRVPTAVMINPKSPLSLWYARYQLHNTGRSSALNLHPRFGEHTLREYYYEWICRELEKGAPYSSDHLYDKITYDRRFELMSCGGPGFIVSVIDHHRTFIELLDVSFLDNPLFDLRRWLLEGEPRQRAGRNIVDKAI